MSRRVLLVEGTTDKYFFEVLLQQNGLNRVEVFPPKDSGARGDGVNNLLATAIPKHLQEIERGAIERLGIVADADNNFQQRYQDIVDQLQIFGFTPTNNTQNNKGFIFQRDDAPTLRIGVWIMPDCANTGALEKLLLDTIEDSERLALLQQAQANIEQVKNDTQFENIRFNDTHQSKVELHTWLTWQRKPNNCRTLTPACALKENWLNNNHANITALSAWLQTVFQ